MYKNQLQELAQRSCFNLPSYTCIREGPDHAPRFKATVNFNGEVFESPSYCTTLRQAEHAAAEIALNALSSKGPSQSLAARILDESGVYKNLLQEISQRAGAALPVYTTIRSGLGHLPVFTCTVELAGISFTGEPAKNKKQAEKKAALAAWASLKQLSKQTATSSTKSENDEQEQITIARALVNYHLNELQSPSNNTPMILRRPTLEPKLPAPLSESKILPLIRPRLGPRNRAPHASGNINPLPKPKSPSPFFLVPPPSHATRPLRHPGPSAQSQYPAVLQYEIPYCPSPSLAPPVTIRTAIPVFSALPARPPPICRPPQMVAPPVQIRSVVPVFATPASTLPSSQPREPPPPPEAAAAATTITTTTTTTTEAAAAAEKATPAPAVQPVKEIQAIDEQAKKTTVENLKQLNL